MAKVPEIIEPPPPGDEPPRDDRANRRDNRTYRWPEQCQLGSNDKPLDNLANALFGLRSDPDLFDAFAFDEMARAITLMRPLPGDNTPAFTSRRLTNEDVTRAQEYLQGMGLAKIARGVVHEAINLRAHECEFHPVWNFLNSLEWDGENRVETWLTDYLGVELNNYSAKVGEMFLVAMVARIFDPGCKFDYMLILEGAEGVLKSTACQVLGEPWFSDSLPEISQKSQELSQHLLGKWLIEVGEVEGMTRADSSKLKRFVSRQVEQYRPSFGGKHGVVEPRQCVFVGTTNKSVYLKDSTGGRRFWPVRVGTIDIEALKRDRKQLFAQAVALYVGGALWYPDAEFEREHIKPEQDARYEEDLWLEQVRDYLETVPADGTVTIGEILANVRKVDAQAQNNKASQNRVTAILEHENWIRLPRTAYGRPWGRRK